MQFLQWAMGGQQVWVRRLEHGVLRVVSLGFSMASAHAIRWFFAPLDGVDALQPAITWMIALGFGLLGYFVSRGLAHRLMNHERIRAYAPICVVVEVVEIFCNYALAAAVIQRAAWLQAVPIVQRTFLTDATYVVLSIIPLVSLLLAVVDMDMERSKGGGMGGGGLHVGLGGGFGGLGGRRQAQPKVPSYAGVSNAPGVSGANLPYPAYTQGYNGNASVVGPSGAVPLPATPGVKAGAGPFVGARPTTALGSSSIP